MNALFQNVSAKKPKRNVFDLGHEKKLSAKFGLLTPIYLESIVPGDKFRVNTEMLVRMAPMLAPIMHRVNVYTHYFFVPNRLVWDNWEKFITGGEDGMQTASFPKVSIETLTKQYYAKGSLSDYFGIPPVDQDNDVTYPLQISALPFRAYQLIYNDYYRDQNLIPKITISTGDSVPDAEAEALLSMRYRAWEKDYFTSALPFTQRGGEVSIPSDVLYKPQGVSIGTDGSPTLVDGDLATTGGAGLITTGGIASNIDNIDTLQMTVNDLRRSVRLQEWLEKNARAGSRYIEQILSHFGVRSSDARLQRPEFLGGGKSPLVVSEINATFNNTETAGGTMYGHGLSVAQNHGFKRTFEEYGYVIGLMSIVPRTAYSQGIEKEWLKFDKFDYYWPEFANLGEQPIQRAEVFHDWLTSNTPTGTFGYQSRYAEYKFKNSSFHSDFRDDLDFWHLGRIFPAQPVLNGQFVSCTSETRIFPIVSGESDYIYVNIYNDVKAIRPMPYYGTPTL